MDRVYSCVSQTLLSFVLRLVLFIYFYKLHQSNLMWVPKVAIYRCAFLNWTTRSNCLLIFFYQGRIFSSRNLKEKVTLTNLHGWGETSIMWKFLKVRKMNKWWQISMSSLVMWESNWCVFWQKHFGSVLSVFTTEPPSPFRKCKFARFDEYFAWGQPGNAAARYSQDWVRDSVSKYLKNIKCHQKLNPRLGEFLWNKTNAISCS